MHKCVIKNMIVPNTMQNLSPAPKYPEPAPRPFVLLFSADPDTRFILKILLGILKYQVVEAQSMYECTRLINRARPGMVLMDVKFPSSEDVASFSELAEDGKFNEIPVVLVSNYPRENFADLNNLLNVKDHLTKPVSFTRLEMCLRENIKNNSLQTGGKGNA